MATPKSLNKQREDSLKHRIRMMREKYLVEGGGRIADVEQATNEILDAFKRDPDGIDDAFVGLRKFIGQIMKSDWGEKPEDNGEGGDYVYDVGGEQLQLFYNPMVKVPRKKAATRLSRTTYEEYESSIAVKEDHATASNLALAKFKKPFDYLKKLGWAERRDLCLEDFAVTILKKTYRQVLEDCGIM